MNFLADENVEAPITAWLRAQGHDVVDVADLAMSAADPDVLAVANREQRILITRDLDFGELVYRQRLVSHGLILVRIRGASMQARLTTFQQHWPQVVAHAAGHFIVMSNHRIRIRPLAAPA